MASLTGDRGLWFHLRDQNSFTTNLEFSQSLSIRSNTFNIYTNIVDEGNGGGGSRHVLWQILFTDYIQLTWNKFCWSHFTRHKKLKSTTLLFPQVFMDVPNKLKMSVLLATTSKKTATHVVKKTILKMLMIEVNYITKNVKIILTGIFC